MGPNHKDGCDGLAYVFDGEGYNRVKLCECGAEDHAPEPQGSTGKCYSETLHLADVLKQR